MPIYYHVSKEILSNNKFIPRIPLFRESDENSEIKRVCVSKSLGGCITSMPQGEKAFSTLVGYTGGLLKVYKIDTEKLNISPSSIIDTEVLYKGNYVKDSFVTNECWITEEFEVPEEDVFYINPYQWITDEVENVSYELRCLAEEKFDNDLRSALESEYGYINIDIIQKIDSLKYQIWNKDTEFILYLYKYPLKKLVEIVKESKNVISCQVFSKEEYAEIDNTMVNLPSNAYVVALKLIDEKDEDFSKKLFELLSEQYEMVSLVNNTW